MSHSKMGGIHCAQPDGSWLAGHPPPSPTLFFSTGISTLLDRILSSGQILVKHSLKLQVPSLAFGIRMLNLNFWLVHSYQQSWSHSTLHSMFLGWECL